MEKTVLLLELYKDEWNTCRNHQSARASMITMFVAIYTALLTFIFSDSKVYTLEIMCVGIVLSIFGYLFSKKHHEKFCFHLNRAREYRECLDLLMPDIYLDDIKSLADNKTYQKFPNSKLIKLNTLWNMVHVVALLSYLVLIIVNFT